MTQIRTSSERETTSTGLSRTAIVFALGFALGCSILYLRTSAASRRLAYDLSYDDVGYVVDAARRLDDGYAHGVVAFIRSFLDEPPHSPVETGIALLGLVLFGYHDWAPYAANAALLCAAVLFLMYAFKDEPRWVVSVVLFTYLTSPIAFRTITELRPDIALGFVTAAFVFLFLRSLTRRRRGEMTAAGALFGIALLVKPSFFAHSLALLMGLVSLYASLRLLTRMQLPEPSHVARSLALGALPALPYYIWNGPVIFRYFWANTQGTEASLWSVRRSMSAIDLLHYVTLSSRGPAISLVGAHIWLFMLGALLGVAVLCVQRRWRDLILPAGLLCAAAGSAAILVVGRVENPFFSASLHALLMLAGFTSASVLIGALAGHARAGFGALLVAASVSAVAANTLIPNEYAARDAVRGESWNEAIVESIRWDARSRGIGALEMDGVTAFVTSAGDVNASALEWTARKRGLRIPFEDLHRSNSPEQILKLARNADYVVATSKRANVYKWLPSAAFQPQLLAALESDSTLARVPVSVGRDQDRYAVFARTALLGTEADHRKNP